MSATTPRPVPPRGRALRAALVLTTAGIVLAGCGRPAEPVASHQTSDPAAGLPAAAADPTTADPATTSPAAAGTSPAPAATSTSGTEASTGTTRPAAHTSAPAPVVAPVAVAPDDLTGIDKSLADIDTQLNDAGHDAATPEGDLG